MWALLYASFSLTRPDLRDGPDAAHAEMAREMVLRHDWITPHLDGLRVLEHPPLLFWSMAASFKVFGIAVWAARLPIALFTLLLFFAVFALGKRLYQSVPAGFYAAIILITSPGIFLSTRLLEPQLAACLWTTLAIRFFWLSLEEPLPSRRTAWGFAAACALNVLTVGLTGLLLPLVTVLLFLAATRGLRHLPRWHPISSLLIFLLIAAPWHIAAGIANPTEPSTAGGAGPLHGFYWHYFLHRNFLWYLHQFLPSSFHPRSVVFFWALLILFLLPWTAFLFKAWAMAPMHKAMRREPLSRDEQALLLPVVWALAALVFFSLTPRTPADTIFLLPPLALLFSAWLADDEAHRREGGRQIAAVLFGLGLVAAAVMLVAALRHAPGDSAGVVLPELSDLKHHLSLTRLSIFRLALLIFAAALLVGTAANLFFRRRGHARLANCFLAGMMVAVLAATHVAIMTLSAVYSSRILADAIRPELDPTDLIVINGDYQNASSFGFYLARPVHLYHGQGNALPASSRFSDAPAVFEDDASLAKQWNGPLRVFLWTRPADLPQLPANVYVIAQSGGKEVVSNQPNSGGAEF